jgi:hypothetical protein
MQGRFRRGNLKAPAARVHDLDRLEAEKMVGLAAQGLTESRRSISFSVNRTEIMYGDLPFSQ